MTSITTEKWTAIAGIAATATVILKKLFSRKPPPAPKPDYVTRNEFHRTLDAMRDRVTAGYNAMTDKFADHQREILSAIGTQGTAIEKRLDALEATVARLDERTKKK